MSTTVMGRFDAGRGGPARFADGWAWLSVPLEAWSAQRRLVVALVVAFAAFVLGVQGWRSADVDGFDASRAALADGQRRLAEAMQATTQLPALRRDALARAQRARPPVWTSADDVRTLSRLADESGLALVSLEPGAESGSATDTMRPVQFDARGDFAQLMQFVAGLAALPVLVVPSDVDITRDGGMLSVKATLQVFSRLPPAATALARASNAAADADDEPEVVFYDPFSPRAADVDESAGASLRLVGLLRDRVHALALVETDDGPIAAAPGQQIGDGRVTHIDAAGLTLATSLGARQLTLAKDAR
ncbi:type 4a pilus biogenesis protein PilO [Paraburkholderia sp.]|uniref:type 4a pilus biogenesis protein PilO n=1 Tax=Paraburkholderia sp. TaxID=1926495 RepID=UPI003D6E8F7F